jgi:eukaryotic-like serine/threonine-protein kinase
MGSHPSLSSKIRFAAFELDASAGKLFKSGIPIKLQPQPLRLLLLLTRRPGEVVTREEIQRCLWGDSTFVDFERGINFSINQIRAALRDNAEKPRYIETLPRIGYRFIAVVAADGVRNPIDNAARHDPSLSVNERSSDPRSSNVSPGTPSKHEDMSASQMAVSPRKRPYKPSILVAALVILVTIGFVALKYQPRRKVLNLHDMQITKLTDSGTAEDTAISPDGRYVVYAVRDGEREGLWLRQIATGSDVEILPPDTRFHGLTFSPDGNYIYFVRSDKNDPLFKYLYSIPTLGGPARKLISDVDSPVSFSPDGNRFVYERCIPTRNEIELKIADTSDARERLLTTLHNSGCSLFQPGPTWSPNGRTIVLPVSLSGKQQGWVLDIVSVSNGIVRPIHSSAYDLGRSVWLAGGDTLLMPLYDPGSRREQLWTISVSTGETRRLTNDLSEYGTELDITRDGGTVAAIARTRLSNLWVTPATDLSKLQQITAGNLPMADIASARGRRVLAESVDGRVWIMNADGGERTLLADEAGWLTPCGRYVVFASYKAGGVTLMRMNVDGSNATKLVSGGLWKPLKTSMSTRAPVCSPDGKFVFYVNSGQPQKICRVSVEGGNPVESADILGDGIAGRLTISPDGKFLAYLYDKYSGTATPGWKLAVIPVNGGRPVKEFEVPGGIAGPRWSPDGKGLQYLLTRNGTTNLWELQLAGGQPRQLTRFTSGQIFDFSWSSDHTRLLLTRGSVSSDVILLTNLR